MFKTKIRPRITWQRVLALVGLTVLIGVSTTHPLGAQAVTEGYDTDGTIQRGMIVRLKKDDANKIEPVKSEDAGQMHGVAVNANDAPLTLSNSGERVFVATTGHYDVLISNQNGSINSGDYIALSSVAGIGMKAGSKEEYVIGRALAGFDGAKDVVGGTELKDTTGATQKIAIGRIQVDIGVAKNPLLKATEPNLPSALQRAANTIAGKPVNAVKVYISLVVFAISSIVAGSLLYGGVRSAIISIGRNPLSKKSIIKGMIQVIIFGLTIFFVGVFGVYLILRL